jgi:hypothetical protein
MFLSWQAILPARIFSTPSGRENICPVTIDRANIRTYPASAFIRFYRAQAGVENILHQN